MVLFKIAKAISTLAHCEQPFNKRLLSDWFSVALQTNRKCGCFFQTGTERQMSSRELEEQIELKAKERLASSLGLSIEEIDELDYEIHTNESNDGLVYEYVVHISESSPSEILSKIDGLSSVNCVHLQPYDLESDPYEDELVWDILSSKQFENFLTSMKGAKALISNLPMHADRFDFYVMLHAHIVASIEAFLSSTFIHSVTNSEELTRKVIETEPQFKDQKIQLSEIYLKRENIKNIVADYLKGIIFHKIKIASRLYKSVLDIDFGDIKWLSDAIVLRHDCTHRGGFDKHGGKINVSESSINDLIEESMSFCQRIHSEVIVATKL